MAATVREFLPITGEDNPTTTERPLEALGPQTCVSTVKSPERQPLAHLCRWRSPAARFRKETRSIHNPVPLLVYNEFL